MSLLSKSEYTKVVNELQSLNQNLTQESAHLANKISLALARVDCIEESISGIEQDSLHESANRLLEIHNMMNSAQANVRKAQEKHKANITMTCEQIDKQTAQLNRSINSTNQQRARQLRSIQTKLDNDLQEIQREAQNQHMMFLVEKQLFRKNMLQQIATCKQNILTSRQKIVEEEHKTVGKLQTIEKDIKLQISKLKDLRKQKKLGFLQLLENVVEKIKQTETFKL